MKSNITGSNASPCGLTEAELDLIRGGDVPGNYPTPDTTRNPDENGLSGDDDDTWNG